MRLMKLSIAAACLLCSGVASAAPSKGDTGGKGGPGPGAGPAPGGGAGEASAATDGTYARERMPDRGKDKTVLTKPWEIGATWETHRMIRQEDLGGAAANKTFNVLDAYFRYDISKNDRVTLRGGFYERFMADAGETGFRLDDTTLAYAHYFRLPQELIIRPSFSLSAPTSFESQKMGLITEPRLGVSVVKHIGRFSAELRLTGTLYVQKYREAEGGSANPKGGFSGLVEADYKMPFLEDLSLGAAVYTSWLWLYDVTAQGRYGAVNDANYASQPVFQSYGGELFIRYYMPVLAGIKSDLSLALAQGDPALGYSSVLHEGVQHVYPFYRQTAEVYGGLSVRY